LTDLPLALIRDLMGKPVEVKDSFEAEVPDAPFVVSIKTWRFGMMARGRTRSEALWRVVDAAALERLEHELRRMGWTEVDRFIDEAEFVVGRDPEGVRWGIAASDDDVAERRWLLEQIGLEDGIDSAAVIDFRDITDPERIRMTLAAANQ